MRPQFRRWGVIACGAVVCVSLGAGMAVAQDDLERLRRELQVKQEQYRMLQRTLEFMENQGDGWRRREFVPVRTARGVVFLGPEDLARSLRPAVILRAISAWRTSGDYGQLGRIADEGWISAQMAQIERDLRAESESVLHDLMTGEAQMNAEARLLRRQIEDIEEQLRILTGISGRGLPPGSFDPGRVEAGLSPASRRVCPSPLFGQLLYGASGARCVGDEDTMFPGWRFGSKEPLVCAHCTPNCSFFEEPGGRLICAVTGAWNTPTPPPARGRTAGPRTPPGSQAPGGRPEDVEARKKALGQELERIRLAGRWSPDHHYQVGIWLGNCRDNRQLDGIETLIYDYAACYDTLNSQRDRISETAKAGRYRNPGERIGALDAAGRALNACLDAAKRRAGLIK